MQHGEWTTFALLGPAIVAKASNHSSKQEVTIDAPRMSALCVVRMSIRDATMRIWEKVFEESLMPDARCNPD